MHCNRVQGRADEIVSQGKKVSLQALRGLSLAEDRRGGRILAKLGATASTQRLA